MLNFDTLEPIQEPVRIRNENYVLLEAEENVAIKWRNNNVRGAKMKDGSVVGVDNIAESQSLLVSQCLYKCKTTGEDFTLPLDVNGKPDKTQLVNINIVRAWPASIVRSLFEKAKEISKLGEKLTAEDIKKQIAKLQEQLEELEPGKVNASEDGTSST